MPIPMTNHPSTAACRRGPLRCIPWPVLLLTLAVLASGTGALLAHLAPLIRQRSLVLALESIPLQPGARVVGDAGGLRKVAASGRPTCLVGIECRRRRGPVTLAALDDRLDAIDRGIPLTARLAYTTAGDDDLHLAARLPSLCLVALNSTRVTDAGLHHLRNLPRLSVLDLSDTAVTDKGLRTIGELRSLQFLDLEGTRVTGRGLQSLAGLSNLEVLDLSDTVVAGDGLESLAELPRLNGLSTSGLSIGDLDLDALCRLKRIRNLDVSRTGITDRGLMKLAGIETLEGLCIAGTRVTDEGVAEFRKLRPRVAIVGAADGLLRAPYW